MSHNGLFGGAFMAMKEDIAAHGENPFCLQGGLAAVLVAGFALGRTGAIYESTTLILDSFELLAATKLVKAGVFVALALLFFYGGKSEGRSKDRTGTLLVMTLVAFAVYGAIFLSGNLAGVTSFGFQILGLVMEGASEAIGIYLYATMMAQMNRGPELMLLGFAATNGISAVLSTLSPVPNAYLLLAFQVVGLLALAFTMRYLEPASGAMPMAAAGRLPGETESAGLFAFVAACLFVNAVAGFYISIPSVGGTPLSGAEKSIIGVLLFLGDLAVYAVFRLCPDLSLRLEFLFLPLALCLAGLLLMPLSGEAVGTRIGIVVVRVGRDLFEVCSWVWALNLVRRDPGRGRPLLCLVMAVSSFYFGALIAKGVEGAIATSELAFARVNVAVAAILALCVALIGAACQGKGTGNTKAGGQNCADDGMGARLADFDRHVIAMARELSLDERESAVLVDAIHGFSGEAIGARLGYSRDAVKFSLAKIYAKAGVSNKQELVEKIETWELRE